MRESKPPTPTPDLVKFDRADYKVPHIGLCAVCLAAGRSASNPVRPLRMTGIAAEVEGCEIVTPDGKGLRWVTGVAIPAGADWLADLARLFGDQVMWGEGPGHPLPMMAVTTVDGTMLCALHAHPDRDTFRRPGSRRP